MNRRQHGFNLISLMVGTVVSMISILALLSLYKALVGTSVTTLVSARQDGQLAAAQLTAQKELQSGGFGIADAKAGTQLLLLKNASLNDANSLSGTAQVIPTLPSTASSGDAEGNALVWSYKELPTGSVMCSGLLVQDGALSRLKSTGNCASNVSLSGVTWSQTILIATGQSVPVSGEAKPWPFAARLTTCWPFGRRSDSSTLNYLQVSLKTRASSVDTRNEALVVSNTVCLPNFLE